MKNWVVITGSAKRIGAQTAKYLHSKGYNLVIHYHHSHEDALGLKQELIAHRADSVVLIQSALDTEAGIHEFLSKLADLKCEVSALINNASSFTPTPLATTDFAQCQSILTTNLVAPYLLSIAFAKQVNNKGVIINLLDIHGKRPLLDHGLYSISKAALEMATLSLAQELAPKVRVNGVAPGAIIWPEQSNVKVQKKIINDIPLERIGSSIDIAKTIGFLLEADYISGQVIAVDGGRSAVGFSGAQ